MMQLILKCILLIGVQQVKCISIAAHASELTFCRAFTSEHLHYFLEGFFYLNCVALFFFKILYCLHTFQHELIFWFFFFFFFFFGSRGWIIMIKSRFFSHFAMSNSHFWEKNCIFEKKIAFSRKKLHFLSKPNYIHWFWWNRIHKLSEQRLDHT